MIFPNETFCFGVLATKSTLMADAQNLVLLMKFCMLQETNRSKKIGTKDRGQKQVRPVEGQLPIYALSAIYEGYGLPA